AAELAQVLTGLVEFTSEMAKTGLFGDGIPPEVRVRPVREGTVIVEAILLAHEVAPEVVAACVLGTGGLVVASIRTGVKKLRGVVVSKVTYQEGTALISWADGSVDE